LRGPIEAREHGAPVLFGHLGDGLHPSLSRIRRRRHVSPGADLLRRHLAVGAIPQRRDLPSCECQRL
jgi:hypothetical protein